MHHDPKVRPPLREGTTMEILIALALLALLDDDSDDWPADSCFPDPSTVCMNYTDTTPGRERTRC